MNEQSKLIDCIEKKVKTLQETLITLNTKNTKIKEENEILIRKNEHLEKKIIEIEEENRMLLIGKTVVKTEGTIETKQKINELVREIDKCIALLNR